MEVVNMTYNSTIFKGSKNYDSPWYKKAINLRNQLIRRCTDPAHHNYPRYGGSGVKVCDRWVDSIDNFLEDLPLIDGWDYDKWINGELQLDKDYKGKKYYSVDSCMWLSPEQNNALGNGEGFIAINPDGKNVKFRSAKHCAESINTTYDKVIKRASGGINNQKLLNGWFIPLQSFNEKPKRRKVQPPLYVKDVVTSNTVLFDSVKDVSDYLGVGLKAVRSAINPDDKHTLIAGKYIVRDDVTPFKKGQFRVYRVIGNGVQEEYATLNDMAKDLSLNITCISECLNGKQKTHRGYSFEDIIIEF